MGRRRILIEEIKEPRNKQVTFAKRKRGLQKKCWELSKLCSAEVALIIFNSAGKLFTFSSCDLETIVKRYSATPKSDVAENRSTEELASKFLNSASTNGSRLEHGNQTSIKPANGQSFPHDDPGCDAVTRLRSSTGQSIASITELSSMQQSQAPQMLSEPSLLGDMPLLSQNPMIGDPSVSDQDLDESMSLPSGCFEHQLLEIELASVQGQEHQSALKPKAPLSDAGSGQNIYARAAQHCQRPTLGGQWLPPAQFVPKGMRYKRRRQVLSWPAAYRKQRTVNRSMLKCGPTWPSLACELSVQSADSQ